jgi:hypothetical protein
MLKQRGSISTKTGLAPNRCTQPAVAKKGKRRGDDLVARTDTRGHQGHQNGIGARTHRDGVRASQPFGDPRLEGGDLRTTDERLAGQHAVDRGTHLRLQLGKLRFQIQHANRIHHAHLLARIRTIGIAARASPARHYRPPPPRPQRRPRRPVAKQHGCEDGWDLPAFEGEVRNQPKSCRVTWRAGTLVGHGRIARAWRTRNSGAKMQERLLPSPGHRQRYCRGPCPPRRCLGDPPLAAVPQATQNA